MNNEQKIQTIISGKYDEFDSAEKKFLHELYQKDKNAIPHLQSKLEKIIFYKKPPSPQEFLDYKEGWLSKATIDSLYSYIIDDFYEIIENSQKYNIISLYGATRIGKCEGRNTPILMYDLSIKMIQDIVVGDKLMGDDNSPRTVLETHKGYGKLYKVKQSKADDYIVNENHTLVLWFNGVIKEISIKDFLLLNEKEQKNYKGIKAQLHNPKNTYKKPILSDIKVTQISDGSYFGFELDGNHRYLHLDLTITHNSYLTRLLILYTQIYIHFLRDPNTYFGLAPDTNLSQYLICFNYSKTKQLLLSPIWKLIRKSERFKKVKFKDEVRKKQEEMGIDYFVYSTATEVGEMTNSSDFWLLLGNDSPLSFIGNDVVQMFITEITYFVQYEGTSEEEIYQLYSDGIDRIKATMGSHTPLSFILLDASANRADSLIEKHILKDLKGQSDVFFRHRSRWDARPHLFPTWQKTGDTFKVITGDGTIPASIVKNKAQLIDIPKNLILDVPIDLYDDFKRNISKSIKDIAGRPTSNENKFIQDERMIKNIFNNKELINIESIIIADAESLPEQLIWNQVYNKFFTRYNNKDLIIKRASREPRFIGIDLAHAVKGDLVGIAMIHKEWNVTRKQVMYVADFSFVIGAGTTGINLDAVTQFIIDITTIGNVYIKEVLVDGFQSVSLIQSINRIGVKATKQSVDKEIAPYQFLMTCMANETLKVGKNVFLKNNLNSLIRTQTKSGKEMIDHTNGEKYYKYDGSFEESLCGINGKDNSDGLCQAVYGARNDESLPITDYEIENKKYSVIPKDVAFNIEEAYKKIHTSY